MTFPHPEEFAPPTPDELLDRLGKSGERMLEGARTVVCELPDALADVCRYLLRR